MEELKSLFGEGSLSYEEFTQKLGEAKDTINLANLKSDKYVGRDKLLKTQEKLTDLQAKYSALEKSSKDYGDLQTNYETLKAEFDALKDEQEKAKKIALVSEANVDSKFAKFVMAEVQALVNDGKDFQTALGEFLKENNQYLIQPKSPYANLERGLPTPKTSTQKMNDFIRSKAKKNGL